MNNGSNFNFYHEISNINDDVQLPQKVKMKYLGECEIDVLWGGDRLRSSVDKIVERLRNADDLDLCVSVELFVNQDGIYIVPVQSPDNLIKHRDKQEKRLLEAQKIIRHFPISHISYVVQDVRYPKVFAMNALNTLYSSSTICCYCFLAINSQYVELLVQLVCRAFNLYPNTQQ
ncbi:hypothetical protein SNEBB_000659 [Seison nebaliae]|nr:hypothetical protein SNEBB_000659 [Seison nebaliae]